MITPLKAIIAITFALIASWVMLHVLALLGVFLALAYPIWWLFFPRMTTCIACNTLPENSLCPLCHRAISKSNIHPVNFASVIKNSFIIFLISLLSLGIVFLETKVLYYFGIPGSPKTATFVIPDKGQYRLDEIFPMKIEIVGISTPINAVQTDLSFDPRKLKVVEIDTEGSFANIFIQKEINNETGYARLTGGLPNPGFTADHGLFGTVYFQGLQPGIATIEYLDSSKILANDGHGTNIIKDLGSVSYLILPERISSPEAQLQTALFSTQVLGIQSPPDQLHFYSDNINTSVLGSSTSSTQIETVRVNFFLNLLAGINDFILRFWISLSRAISLIFT